MTTNKNHNSPNVPNLRFPEFEGEWEKIKLKDVCTFYSGGTPSSSNKDYYTGDIPFIRSGELHESCTELFISKDGLNNSSAKIVHKGDLLLALYGATSGDIAISQIEGAINQAILCINTEQSKEYIKAVWQKHVQKILQTYLQGGQGNLSADIVKNISFYFALSKEQDKLANFIRLLDERIATQNKIIEDLKLLKSAIVDKLTTPQKEWKSTKIGNVLSIGSGRDYKHLEDGSIPVYGTGGYMLSVDSYLYDGESVCIGRKGTINKPIFLKGKFWTVDTLFYTHTFRSITPRFCYYLFTTIDWLKYNEASGVPSLSKVTIENISISIPDLVTQKRFCAVLDSMTDKLDIEQKLLDAYHAQKQYLLQQIFI